MSIPEITNQATHLYLIRHGQAVVNVTGAMGGPRGDIGLTDLGCQQAALLRDRLREKGEIQADVLLTSSLPRARETAEILAPALDLPIVMDDDLQELRVGPEADGLPLDEYKRRFGWVDFRESPFTPVDPGGESWAAFMLRVGRTLSRITREHAHRTIVAVCHGGIIDASFIHFFGMNAHEFPRVRFYTENTSLTHWEYMYRDDQWQWRLVSYNDVAHLRSLALQTAPPTAAPVPTETG